MPDVINLVSSDDEDSTERCRADMPEVISLDSPQVRKLILPRPCPSALADHAAMPGYLSEQLRSSVCPSAEGRKYASVSVAAFCSRNS